MSERRGTKALETWCRRLTDGYPGVKVENMTTSWRDGLAFCAIIHHFRPDLIDFTSLNKNNVYYNNNLAFRVAEVHLGIPALLDAEDMVEYAVPDRLSILTYLSQFYQVFGNSGNGSPQGGNKQGSSTRLVPKRSTISSDRGIISPASSSPPTKMAARSGIEVTGNALSRREPCAKCGFPVFLAERLNVGTKLYHRTCFRCARCSHQLSLANCYETETNGQFCCETCPDEEETDSLHNFELQKNVDNPSSTDATKVRNRSLSDEEKSKGLLQFEDDEYSADFENILGDSDDKIYREQSLLSKARTHFLSTHLLNEDTKDAVVPKIKERDNTPPPLPETEPPDVSSKTSLTDEIPAVPELNSVVYNIDLTIKENDPIVNSINSCSNSKNQQDTASDTMLEETTNLRETNITKDANRSSLVKSRMLIFENKEKTNVVSKYSNSIKKDDETVPSKELDDLEKDISIESNQPKVVDDNYETVRSEINSDSVDLETSIISETDSPQNETKVDTLTQSVLENLTNSVSQDTSSQDIKYPEDLNPFGDEDENEEENKLDNIRQIIKPSMEDLTIITPPKSNVEQKTGTNPFGSSEDEEEESFVAKPKPPRPPLPAVRVEGTMKMVKAPRISLNPFWSDEEDDEQVKLKPVPHPRKNLSTPEPKPRQLGLSNNAERYDSTSSLSSMNSSMGCTPGKKKKPAPLPPSQNFGTSLTPDNSIQSSPSTSRQSSPKSTPKNRKNRKAPLPPTSTPFIANQSSTLNISPIVSAKQDVENSSFVSSAGSLTSIDVENEKISKDEKNRNRQSQSISSPVFSDSDSQSLSHQGSSSTDKSTHGKWKRKKGPAPARPVPQRRQIRPLPLAELKRELDIIEMQQQGLEKQGVKLEQLIREKCEIPGSNDDTALSPEVEDLVLELFELVNEKNELFRRQAELMYLRRQQRLEEEYADLEYQIRCLMDRPERNKTDSDKAREEELISRLVEVVERRNEIVDCLEMDRVRETEEDQSIHSRLNEIASKKDEESQNSSESPVKLSKKEKKKMKKEKKLKEKGKTLDIDKDIDESETGTTTIKEKKKKKWF